MSFSADVQNPPPPPPPGIQIVVPERKPVGALKAILLFLVYGFTQFIVGLIVTVVYIVATGKDAALAASLVEDPVLLLIAGTAGFVVGGPVIVALARAMEGGRTWKEALAPFGMVKSSPRAIAAGVGLGVATALVLGFGLELIFPSPENAEGPLIEAASAPGWQRILFVLLAVLLAPVFEEFLFRGVMYTGMLRSWGKWPAGIVVTLSFGLLHLADVGGYWPALFMITVVGLGLLLVRIKTKSLIPAIAMHSAYNLFQVLALYFLM
jgi:membrane protease YdiL (CAAX protease family)